MSSTARRRRLQRLCAASVACLVASGCATSAGTDAPAGREATASGVGVVAEGCSLAASVGSGVVVDGGDGGNLVITVAHTIKGATSVTVVDVNGVEYESRVLAFDKDADLAVLDVAGLSAPGLGVATDPFSFAGETEGSILTWGPEEGVERVPIELVKPLIVTIEDIYVDEVVERTALEIAGSVTGGDSGGPVLDADGDVVGIVYANSRGRDQVGFATDQRELAAILESAGGATVDNGTCF
jgi:S1-C subfamily serine protease